MIFFSLDKILVMKKYQSIRDHVAIFGIYDSQLNKTRRNNVKSLLILFSFYLTATSVYAFMLFDSQSFGVFAQSFTIALTIIVNASDLAIIILKTEKLFEFMNDFESIIEKSKYNTIESI